MFNEKSMFTTLVTFGQVIDFTMDLVNYASPKDTHGPVVKTGPTRGQNRSRNKNGRWRKTRSDAGKSRK